MDKNNKLKEIVRKTYSDIAHKDAITSCCNNSACCSSSSKEVYNIMSEDYKNIKGYNSDADFGLGCGIPTQFAGIKKGNIVIDLGSGAGNDCFVAHEEVGKTGKVIGIDFAPAMIEKAIINATNRNLQNIQFILGDIEEMPLEDNLADVVISNCVLNLLPNKDKIFNEVFRVLKPSGHFCISDIVLEGELPQSLKDVAEMYAGCITGAIQKRDYLIKITNAGFGNVKVVAKKCITIPDSILLKYLTEHEISMYRSEGIGIYSITVTGVKNQHAT